MPKHTQSNQKHSDYFEAIIQVRPKNEEITKFIIKKTEERKGVFISKIMEKKEGLDFYISSQRFAIAMGRKLKKTYKKGTLKITRSLYSRNKQTSKNIYRVTVLFRC